MLRSQFSAFCDILMKMSNMLQLIEIICPLSGKPDPIVPKIPFKRNGFLMLPNQRILLHRQSEIPANTGQLPPGCPQLSGLRNLNSQMMIPHQIHQRAQEHGHCEIQDLAGTVQKLQPQNKRRITQAKTNQGKRRPKHQKP